MNKFSKIQRYLRVINPYILSVTKPKFNDYSKVMIISGSPRSGTTWLGELISNIPKSIMLFEPLNLNHNPKALQQGFKWRTYINSKTIDKNANEFFTNLLKGKNLNL